jgi:hypothetical protein
MALVAFLASVSTVAAAKCPTDLKGVWQTYSLINDDTVYSSCTFTTDRDGNLEPGSTCQLFNAVIGDPGGDILPVTGQYVIDGNTCDVTGSQSIANDFVIITILKASVSNDGQSINGISTDTFTNSARKFSMFRIN